MTSTGMGGVWPWCVTHLATASNPGESCWYAEFLADDPKPLDGKCRMIQARIIPVGEGPTDRLACCLPDPLRRRETMGIRNSELLVQSEFTTDESGHPTGGLTVMNVVRDGELHEVIHVEWQDGIIPDGGIQNGAFIEDVLEAAKQRIQFFNSRPQSRCRENSLAITKIEEALQWLDWRTRNRVNQGVENTYEKHEDGGALSG